MSIHATGAFTIKGWDENQWVSHVRLLERWPSREISHLGQCEN
jgi:hypothetical protein